MQTDSVIIVSTVQSYVTPTSVFVIDSERFSVYLYHTMTAFVDGRKEQLMAASRVADREKQKGSDLEMAAKDSLERNLDSAWQTES